MHYISFFTYDNIICSYIVPVTSYNPHLQQSHPQCSRHHRVAYLVKAVYTTYILLFATTINSVKLLLRQFDRCTLRVLFKVLHR